MDTINIYLIILGVFLALFILSRSIQLLSHSTFPFFKCFFLRFLIFPTLLKANRWINLTRFEVVAIAAYLSLNIVPLFIATTSLQKTTATTACVNLVFTFLGKRINPLVEFLGISIHTYYLIHRLTGWLAVLFACIHGILIVARHEASSTTQTVSGYIAAACLLLIFLTTLWHSPRHFIRSLSKLHLALGLVCLSSMMWHTLLNSDLRTKVLTGIVGSVFIVGAAYRLIRVAFFSTSALVESYQNDDQIVQLKVRTSRPISIAPGSYFYIFRPGSLLRYNYFTSYPLTASWQQGRNGLLRNTSEVLFIIDTNKKYSTSLNLTQGQRILLDGPYRQNLRPEIYDIVILVAEGRGIAAVMPLMLTLSARRVYDKATKPQKKLLFRDQTRHVDLFWWLEDNHQDRWVQDQLQLLKSLDPENKFLVVWLLYPKPRARTDKLPFKPNGHWRCVYNCAGNSKEDVQEKFHEAVTLEAIAPGRRIIVTSGSPDFNHAHRDFAIQKNKDNLDIDFVVLENVDIYMQGSKITSVTSDPEGQRRRT